ncbi:MAG: DNA photolyase family protein [Actinobacteria bacterium]|nr:DNA photolyase family protein [Actinomycetota bacterium]MCG2807944.1 DNA photolyase family protein [Coriobacteriia bacterium]
MPTTTVVWFRRDLRLADNPNLNAALAAADRVVPVFVIDGSATAPSDAPGSSTASFAWRAQSLAALDKTLRAAGSQLVVRYGDPATMLAELCEQSGVRSVHCATASDPAAVREATRVCEQLAIAGISLVMVPGAELALPAGSVRTAADSSYRVFTPFYRTWRTMLPSAAPLPAPQQMAPLPVMPESDPLPAARSGDVDISAHWQPGEAGAMSRLKQFTDRAAAYEALHDLPAVDGTSMLSPHLAFGEITPRQVIHALPDGSEAFIRQLAWREFAYSTLAAFPSMGVAPLRAEFARMPWIDDAEGLNAWKAGMTGVPLVDAGMRQLASTGWMHNRVRMVAASWLTKNLLIDWREGERHFLETLVDADAAQNAFNWQWVAGSGSDAAPYFRIMNPAVQASRFDPDGTYIRTWVPELARLAAPWIQKPWDAPGDVLREAGITLGRQYPAPSIELGSSRGRALSAFASIRRSAEPAGESRL